MRVGRVWLAVLGGLVLAGCSAIGTGRPATVASSVGAARTSAAPTAAAATQVVRRYFDLAAAGRWSEAYALWSPQWRRGHAEPAWRASTPLPAGARAAVEASGMHPQAGGLYVPVAVTVPGTLSPRTGRAGFIVVAQGGAARLADGGMLRPPAMTDLQATMGQGGAGVQRGQGRCGTYRIRWSVLPAHRSRPVGTYAGDHTTLTITAAGGGTLPPLPLPPFTFGTYPTYCGDLLGHGTAIVLVAYYNGPGPLRQGEAFAFQLGRHGGRLLGQLPTRGSDLRYPMPQAVGGLYPRVLVARRTAAYIRGLPVLVPSVWAYARQGAVSLYEAASAQYPSVLRADLARRRAELRQVLPCHAALASCAGPALAGAYYDYQVLGQGRSGLTRLEALLPPAGRAWLRSQAASIDFRLRRGP